MAEKKSSGVNHFSPADPRQIIEQTHNEPSHHDLHCLLFLFLIFDVSPYLQQWMCPNSKDERVHCRNEGVKGLINISITALASPLPPVMETPGLKQIQKHLDLIPDPTAKLQFDKNLTDSPTVPVFQTPGIKQIAAVAPRQVPVESKKAVVGLFKGDGARDIKQEPDTTTVNKTYLVDSEPQPPDLTYSLEVSFIMIFFIAPDKRGYPHNIFSYFSMNTYVVGTH